MPELNFEEDKAIDLDDLHMEWAKQGQKRKKYADEVSYLEDVMKKSHEKVKVIRSKLILEAKKEGYGNATLQEAYYRNHDDHKEAKKEILINEYNLSMAWNALNAINDLKPALENEVALWKGNYFATPREERMVESGKMISKEIAGEKVETHRTEINQRRRRKK